MYLLRHLLDLMTQNYAMTFRPLNLAEIKRLSITLKKNKLGVIPSDYAFFLCWTDGLTWNGLELFSVYPHERSDTVYPQPTLLEAQQKSPLENAFPDRLVLGRCWEDLICYNSKTKLYEILNRFTYEPVLTFSRFVDLLYHYAHFDGVVTLPTDTAS